MNENIMDCVKKCNCDSIAIHTLSISIEIARGQSQYLCKVTVDPTKRYICHYLWVHTASTGISARREGNRYNRVTPMSILNRATCILK